MRDDTLLPEAPTAPRDDSRPAPVAAPRPRRKPRLRGVSHQIAAIASVPAVAALLLAARSAAGLRAATIYGATLVLLFSVSAVYHRMYWPLSVRRIIGRIDHAAIFLLIAGTYTPFGLLLGPGLGHTLLALVWAGAVLGIVIVVWLTGTPKPIRASLYVLLGWVVLPLVPAIRSGMGDGALALLFAGGLFYTVGAAIYALRRPDPIPEIFGFHEVFHLLVIAAAICHYAIVYAAVRALA